MIVSLIDFLIVYIMVWFFHFYLGGVDVGAEADAEQRSVGVAEIGETMVHGDCWQRGGREGLQRTSGKAWVDGGNRTTTR